MRAALTGGDCKGDCATEHVLCGHITSTSEGIAIVNKPATKSKWLIDHAMHEAFERANAWLPGGDNRYPIEGKIPPLETRVTPVWCQGVIYRTLEVRS